MKRFERSNGLDTALYKNYLYLFTILTDSSDSWNRNHLNGWFMLVESESESFGRSGILNRDGPCFRGDPIPIPRICVAL